MRMRKIAVACLALLFATSVVSAQQTAPPTAPKTAAPAASVTGTWIGSLVPEGDGSPRAENGMLVLKQEGDTVTGTAGPPDRQLAIAKGKIATTKDGTMLTFEVSNDSMVLQFSLKLVDGHLKGGAKAERNGQQMTATADFTKSK